MVTRKGTTVASGLARARVVAAELSANTDALNDGLARVEAALAPLGVDASIETTDDAVRSMGYGTALSFEKHGNRWGLFYAKGLTSEAGTWTPQRLLTCPKVVRLLAIDHLPELIETVVRRAEEQNRMIASSLEKLHGLLAAIEPDVFEIRNPSRFAFVDEDEPDVPALRP
ncbi:MAG: hypothetical protein JWM74_2104 [Myxococcaceae bacterium]|jgi:hypothetical protein|nr:hypothetical protein [Myxococcaceae bacterium]